MSKVKIPKNVFKDLYDRLVEIMDGDATILDNATTVGGKMVEVDCAGSHEVYQKVHDLVYG